MTGEFLHHRNHLRLDVAAPKALEDDAFVAGPQTARPPPDPRVTQRRSR